MFSKGASGARAIACFLMSSSSTQATILNTEVGSSGEDPARRAKARAQAEEALRVSPNLGEAHAALGLCLRDERNYDVALKELERALASSSNNAEIYYYIAQVYR